MGMVQDPASLNADAPVAFAVGVLHGEMESSLESGDTPSARRALARILTLMGPAPSAQFVAAAYRQFDGVLQAAPSPGLPSSPILIASTLRRSLARIGFSGARFELGYWASRCRLAAGKRDAAFFSGQEARRGWTLVRAEALPEPALNALDTAKRLLGEPSKTEAHWRRLEEAFRQFILLL